MPYYNEKKRSPITSEKVKILLECQEHIKKRLEEIRGSCEHSFELLRKSYNTDEYGSYLDGHTEHLHCTICGVFQFKEVN
jgi:hypothetical protein